MSINCKSIKYIQNLVYDLSANVIPDEKSYLIMLRLTDLARQEGFDSVQEFIDHLCIQQPTAIHQRAVEAMMNNETSFFRESRSFEAVERSVLPELIKRRSDNRTLSVWSAACSSGQEPYSIAMLLHEHLPDIEQWKIQITASEYSESILAAASQGRYSQLTVKRGMPPHLLEKYFDYSTSSNTSHAATQGKGAWQIKEYIRQMIKFQQLNLAMPSWPSLSQMDIIFMRNILIYLHDDTKKQILERVSRLLKPDGYLFLGSAETITNIHSSFERIQVERTVAYRLRSHKNSKRGQEACR